MTSFAFILGVLPLVVAHGAGAEMRQALGIAVFSGMLGVTFFGILLTPVFFYVVDHAVGWSPFRLSNWQQVGVVVADVITLGFVRRAVWAGCRRTVMGIRALVTLIRSLCVRRPPTPGSK